MASDAARSRGRPSQAKSVPTIDWLWKPTRGSRTAHKAFLDQAEDDGFLNFSLAIRGRGDTTQEYMVTRFYLFLRDCLSDGLVGAFGHVRGDDVMEHLLCHNGYMVPSLHKVTKQAEAAFAKLEMWMAKGKDWREAQQHDKKTATRKKHTGLAPGLHNPAGRSRSLRVRAHAC